MGEISDFRLAFSRTNVQSRLVIGGKTLGDVLLKKTTRLAVVREGIDKIRKCKIPEAYSTELKELL